MGPKMDLDQLAEALQVFATLDPIEFPLHRAQLLVEIARHNEPGVTFAELEQALSLTNGSVSRGIAALGQVNRYGQPGYRLVDVVKDPRQPRRYLVRLSARGHALLRQLKSI